MHKLLIGLAVFSTLTAAHTDVYVSGGLSQLSGTGHQLTAGVGADTALGNTNLRAGIEAARSFGDTGYSSVAGVVAYEGRNWSPYVKAGKTFGELEGKLYGIGVEYRTSLQYGGWSAGLEYAREKVDLTNEKLDGIAIFARYRY